MSKENMQIEDGSACRDMPLMDKIVHIGEICAKAYYTISIGRVAVFMAGYDAEGIATQGYNG